MVENRDFYTPLAFGAHVRGSPSESINQSVVIATVLYGQTRIVWLPDGEKKFEDMIV